MTGTSQTAARDIAIVTGASAGLGAALAQALTARGVVVAGIGRDLERLNATRDKCMPGLFHAFSADVADPAAMRTIVASLERDVGAITILINNAVIYKRAEFATTNAEHALEHIDINLGGYVNTTAAVLPFMTERGRGRIINVGSFAGENPIPGSLAYSVSKLGCHGFNVALVVEMADRFPGIVVTEWIPGILATNIGREDGLDPATSAAWGATLALDSSPELHGTRFLCERQMVPARSFKRRIKDLVLMRPAPKPRVLMPTPAATEEEKTR